MGKDDDADYGLQNTTDLDTSLNTYGSNYRSDEQPNTPPSRQAAHYSPAQADPDLCEDDDSDYGQQQGFCPDQTLLDMNLQNNNQQLEAQQISLGFNPPIRFHILENLVPKAPPLYAFKLGDKPLQVTVLTHLHRVEVGELGTSPQLLWPFWHVSHTI